MFLQFICRIESNVLGGAGGGALECCTATVLPYQKKAQSKRVRTAGFQPSVYSITGFEPAPVGASYTMPSQLSKEIILVIAITIQHYDMEIEHKFFTTNLSQPRVILF